MIGLSKGTVRAGREVVAQRLRPLLRPRRLDVCCCGLSKTGTHSMAGLFENYRSLHHPDGDVRLPLAIAYLEGEVGVPGVRDVLRRRDRQLWLEMESSSLAGILIDGFAEACPRKKFILTLRDVFSWCDSWIDHNINQPPAESSPWAALDRVRLRVAEFTPTRFDAPLTQRGLPPLACYFQLWAGHNERVLAAVPADRLLVVETRRISASMPEIAAWAGVPPDTLCADRNWIFAAPKKHRVLATLDPSHVRDTADRFCGALMRARFPAVSWQPEVAQLGSES
jgi:hypothetical protein